MSEDQQVRMTVDAVDGGLAQKIYRATQLGHGRLTLIINPTQGEPVVLDIIDADCRDKPEYRHWRPQ